MEVWQMRRFSKNVWHFVERVDLGVSLMWWFQQENRSLLAGVFFWYKGQIRTGGLQPGLCVGKK